MERLQLNRLTGTIVDAALEVHTHLGPGIFENAYELCLARELMERGISVERQHPLPVEYKGTRLDLGYRLDLLVGGSVVVELKTVSKLSSLHKSQLLSYLRLGRFKVGLLINFHESHLKDGIVRMVNRF